MGIQSLIYRATGIMPKTLRMQTSETIGQALVGRDVSAKSAAQALRVAVCSKDAGKIKFTEEFEEAKAFITKKGIGNPEELNTVFVKENNIAALAIPDKKMKEVMVVLPFKNSKKPSEALAAITAHEIQHALFFLNSPQSVVGKIKKVLMGKEKAEKLQKEMEPVIAEKYGDLYFGPIMQRVSMLENTASKKNAKEFFKNTIRERILLPNGDKRNYMILRELKESMRDEARAYKVQFSILNGDGGYNNLSVSFNEAADALKKEQRLQLVNRFKQFFGFKPKDYSIKSDYTKAAPQIALEK